MSEARTWKIGRFLGLCALAASGAGLASGCNGSSRVFQVPEASGGMSGGVGTGGDGDPTGGGTDTSAGGAGGVEGGEAGAAPGSAGALSEMGGADSGSAGASAAGGEAGMAGVECGSAMAECDGVCTNLASDPKNCRACGHDCGSGSDCKAGECQPVELYRSTQPITHLDADAERIYFSPPGVATCPAAGCTLSPEGISDSLPAGSTFVANDYVGIQTPNPNPPFLDTLLQLCPASGCTSDNAVTLEQSNKYASFSGVLGSGRNFYWTASNPGGHLLRACLTPGATGCGNGGTIFGFVGSVVAATDDVVYMDGSFDEGESALYSCPASLSDCTPTPMNPPSYTQAVAYANDLYLAPSVAGPNITIVKCPKTGCTNESQKPVVTVKSNTSEYAVSAFGIYWVDGDLIRKCPLSGCVGAPQTVATTSAPSLLRLRNGFLYWVDTTQNKLYRVAEPAR